MCLPFCKSKKKCFGQKTGKIENRGGMAIYFRITGFGTLATRETWCYRKKFFCSTGYFTTLFDIFMNSGRRELPGATQAILPQDRFAPGPGNPQQGGGGGLNSIKHCVSSTSRDCPRSWSLWPSSLAKVFHQHLLPEVRSIC